MQSEDFEAEVFTDISTEIEEVQPEVAVTAEDKFISELKESVPEFLFCRSSCPKCYGRQHEGLNVDSETYSVCRKLVSRVNRQQRIQERLRSKLVNKVKTDNQNTTQEKEENVNGQEA